MHQKKLSRFNTHNTYTNAESNSKSCEDHNSKQTSQSTIQSNLFKHTNQNNERRYTSNFSQFSPNMGLEHRRISRIQELTNELSRERYYLGSLKQSTDQVINESEEQSNKNTESRKSIAKTILDTVKKSISGFKSAKSTLKSQSRQGSKESNSPHNSNSNKDVSNAIIKTIRRNQSISKSHKSSFASKHESGFEIGNKASLEFNPDQESDESPIELQFMKGQATMENLFPYSFTLFITIGVLEKILCLHCTLE